MEGRTTAPPELNRAKGLAAKAEGQDRALYAAPEWKSIALEALEAWLRKRRASGGTHMTMEEFRADFASQPASPNAWGGLTTAARHAGLIASGYYVNAQSVRTHGHPVMCWRIMVGDAA